MKHLLTIIILSAVLSSNAQHKGVYKNSPLDFYRECLEFRQDGSYTYTITTCYFYTKARGRYTQEGDSIILSSFNVVKDTGPYGTEGNFDLTLDDYQYMVIHKRELHILSRSDTPAVLSRQWLSGIF